MKRAIGWVVAVLVMIGIPIAYYFYTRQPEPPAEPPPPPVAEAPPAPLTPPPPAEPAIQHPLQPAPAEPLPALDESDAALGDALADLIGTKPLAEFFYPDGLIRRIVAAVDNLPRSKVARRLLPVKPVPGPFVTAGKGDALVIGPGNAARYARLMRVAEAIDSAKLVAVYVRFYPLFQRAYEDLGYSGRYFNDRLVEVIDHLLATPEVAQPIRLVQPKILYEFADPELEALSAGQKIMLRIGPENAAKLKAKLQEIRQELARHGAPSQPPE